MSLSTAVPLDAAAGSPRLRAVGSAAAPRPSVPAFVSESDAIARLLDRADKLAHTDVPLLVTGESGTGKEVLARRIHARSRRGDGPLLAENCAAIHESLFESELFGHHRGAFTGADRSRIGLFQRASGGTLLLDEVGELPLGLQSKLLRVLEQGRVRPVGSSREIDVDVRVLSATNRDLAELVREGRFREDLYYRLQGAQLDIPPLRDRREDVLALADHFLAELNADHGTRYRFTPSQRRMLVQHPWFGNARELRNAVHLAFHSRDELSGALELALRVEAPRAPSSSGGLLTRLAPLVEIEREAIALALEESGGNRERAAKRLGISRSSIYERIRRHGL